MPRKSRPSGRKRSPPSQSTHDLRVLNAIRRMIRAADLDSHQLAAQHQITAPQLLSLMAVVTTGAVTASDIAKQVHVSTSTLVGVLDRLEAKGLIGRQRDTEDRRRVSIVATPEGRALVAATPFPLQHALDRALSQLSAAERETLAGWMERLVDLMGAHEMKDGPMLEIGGIRS